MLARNARRRVCGCVGGLRAVLIVCGLALAASWVGAQELPAEAAEALQRAQQHAAEAQLTYSEHYADRPLWSDALAAGEEAVSAAPDHPAPRRFLAQAYGTVGWFARAWDAWQAYLARGGTVDAQVERRLLEVAEWLGYRAFASGQLEQARTYLETMVELDPSHLGANERLGRLHLQAGDTQAALPYLEAAAERDPELEPLLARARRGARFGLEAVEAFEAGQEAVAAGQLQTAREHFARAAEGNPSYLDAWRRAGELSLRLEQPADAVRYLEPVAQARPDDDQLLDALDLAREQAAAGIEAYRAVQRGEEAYARGDEEAARSAFEEAVAASPDYADAHAWLGRLAFEAEAYEEAVRRYQQAVRLAPEESEFQMFLAQSEQLQERAAAEAQAQAEAEAEARAAAQEQAEAQARAEAAAERAAQEAAEREAEEEAARRAEEAAQAAEEAEQAEAADEQAAAQPGPAEEEAEAAAQPEDQPDAAEEAEPEPDQEPEPQQDPEPAAEPEPVEEPQPAEAPEDEAPEDEAPELEEEVAPEPDPEPEPEPAPEPQPEPEPAQPEPEPEEAEPGEPEPDEAEPVEDPAPQEPQEPEAPDEDREVPPADEPLVLVDENVEHRPRDAAASAAFTFLRPEDLDRDLRAYTGGTLHQRLEVLSKPSEAPVRYQLCLVPTDIRVRPACSDAGNLRFTSTGVYEAEQPLASVSGVAAIDWRRGLQEVMLVLRDPEGEPIEEGTLAAAGGSQEARDLSHYYPMRVRYRAVLVPPGAPGPDWR